MVLLHDEALRRRISIRTDLAPDLPRVEVDRVQLQQVLLNLVMNGMDAIGQRRQLGENSSAHPVAPGYRKRNLHRD